MGAGTGTQMRVTVKANTMPNGCDFKLIGGQQAASGDSIDVTAATPFTFGGNAIETGDGTTTEWVSDWIDLNEAYDGAKAYVFCLYDFTVDVVVLPGYDVTGNTGGYHNRADGNAELTNRSAVNSLSANSHFVKKIEIR
jgi:hypothetical protein